MRASGFTSSNVGVAFDNFAVFWFQSIFFKSKKNCSGRQMPPRDIGVSNATRRYWGVKCQLGVLGRQMPPGGIGASNATWGCWGVKGHPEVIGASKACGRQKAGASKGPIALRRQRPQGVRLQGNKIRASGFMLSKVPGVKGDESRRTFLGGEGSSKIRYGPI